MNLIKDKLVSFALIATILFEHKCSSLTLSPEEKNIATFVAKLSNVKAIDLNTCWKKQRILNFNKLLTSKNICLKDKHREDLRNHQLIHVVDLNCKNSLDLILKANATNRYKAPSKWVVITDDISNFPRGLNIFVSSRVYLYQRSNNVVYSIFRHYDRQEYEAQTVAIFEHLKIVMSRQVVDFKHRKNLRKNVINVGNVIAWHKTFDDLLSFRNLQHDNNAKFHAHLIVALIDVLNATMVTHYSDVWGGRIGNTTSYSGLIGQFQNGTIDIGATCAFMTRERLRIMDYNLKYNSGGKLIFRQPPLSVVRNILRMPLQDDVWAAMFLLVPLALLVVFVIVKWEWSESEALRLAAEANALRPRLSDVAQMQIGAMFQQGSEAEPKSVSGQLATFVLFVSFLFFFTAYSACIVALLQSAADNINTLDDMTASDIRVKVHNISYMPFYIQNALTSDAVIRFHKAKMTQPQGQMYAPLHQGIAGCVRDDFCAFLVDEDRGYKEIIKTFTEAEKCGLKAIPLAAEIYPYVPQRKGHEYSELFRVSFALFNEVGLRKRNHLRVLTAAPRCEYAGGIFRSVSLTDCYFALLCFSIGLGASVAVFISEMLYKTYESRNVAED